MPVIPQKIPIQFRTDERTIAAIKREVNERNKNGVRITTSALIDYLVNFALRKIAQQEVIDEQSEGAL